MWFTLNR